MTLQEKDKHFVWHPFTHQALAKPAIPIMRGEGLYFYDEQGKSYMDAISSWWVNLHGHCHPYISQKVSEQLHQLEHSIFSDYTHEPAISLAERLLDHFPDKAYKVFFSDNGSTAVEVALKMAIQFAHNKGIQKHTFVAFEDAYHGDTFGGMSVGARNVFNQAFENFLFEVVHLPLPNEQNHKEVENLLSKTLNEKQVAAFIFEPLVQGASGMQMYEARYLDRLLQLCKQHTILTIADEVMTGFGRTGRFFASDYLEHKPDITCLSKGLTGGYMPMGVTICKDFIHAAYFSEDKTKTFFHGHSYTANPTACSAALASLDLLEQQETRHAIVRICQKQKAIYNELIKHLKIENVRCFGTILALDFKNSEETTYLNSASQNIAMFFQDKGILVRPLGNVLYFIPPYCTTNEELDYMYEITLQFLAKEL
jgi:adenosylmethionine---8-amino-7-oxononanoate aminotransferase